MFSIIPIRCVWQTATLCLSPLGLGKLLVQNQRTSVSTLHPYNFSLKTNQKSSSFKLASAADESMCSSTLAFETFRILISPCWSFQGVLARNDWRSRNSSTFENARDSIELRSKGQIEIKPQHSLCSLLCGLFAFKRGIFK